MSFIENRPTESRKQEARDLAHKMLESAGTANINMVLSSALFIVAQCFVIANVSLESAIEITTEAMTRMMRKGN